MWVDGSQVDERIEIVFTAGVWEDVSEDAFDYYQFDNGIRGGDILRRTATPGQFEFWLNNSARNSAGLAGFYSPGHENVREGFAKGAEVRIGYVYEGICYYKWRGTVEDILPEPGFPGQRTRVVCKNFIRRLQNVMELPVMVTEKTAAEGVAEIIGKLAVSPAEMELGDCETTYEAIFDVIKRDSSGLREISRLMLGEMGWFYVKGNQRSGEVLTVQGRQTRAVKAIRQVPVGAARSGRLLLENGGYLLLETGGRLVLDQVEALAAEPRGLAPAGVSAVYNEVVVKVYPRREDEDVVTLYEHPRAIELEPGAELVFSVAYADPEQTAQSVTAASVVYPLVAGVDYGGNTAKDGSGDDVTEMVAVDVLPGVAAADVSLVNLDEENTVYVLPLKIRGKGRYAYQAVEVSARDDDSIAAHQRQRLEIDTAYLSEPATGKALAEAILAVTKTPVSEFSIGYLAPLMSSQHFFGFLFLEPGERLRVEDETTGIDEDYFVQHLTVVRTEQGDLNVTYTLLSERLSTI